MIEIEDKSKCCGCSACVQRCPKQCIAMHEDAEGFLYPEVDDAKCIGCRLCEKVCPVINQSGEREPLAVYAAKNLNEDIRMQSSSGGVFTLLAEKVLDEGGVVFGACFDDRWEVVHQSAESKAELAKFRGSKYVQSCLGETFQQAESYLKQGRKVLYSGTPCQIAGLKHYLRKDYENLLAVDFICHGVPSPGVFRSYLQGEIDKTAAQGAAKNTVSLPFIPLISERDGLDFKGCEIKSISFRDKRNGWKKFGFALVLSKASAVGEENSVLPSYETLRDNPYLRGFLKDIYLRPSCYACPAKKMKSGSDITLGDWWGIDTLKPEIDDDRGVSVVTVNTKAGKTAFENISVEMLHLPYEELIKHNPSAIKPVAIPGNRSLFFERDGKSFDEKIRTLAKDKIVWKNIAYRIVYKVMPTAVIKVLKSIIKK